ncbi:MAG: transcription antitermination factor NusB [Alphaproteobacteria bacterium]|nr:transcription antitermination factor NusB [Alphaproteobacteria bacterium]
MAKFVSEKIKMKSSARLAAVQATYTISFSGEAVEEVIREFANGEIGRYVVDETELGKEEMVMVEPMDKAYFENLVRGVHKTKEDLEKSLNSFLSSGRSLDHCDGTLQALLLCAMYEIANNYDVDVKVIIQEYVDMAYAFYNKNEPKMVNALLDQIAKQIRA